jgi:hypothetical protein
LKASLRLFKFGQGYHLRVLVQFNLLRSRCGIPNIFCISPT